MASWQARSPPCEERAGGGRARTRRDGYPGGIYSQFLYIEIVTPLTKRTNFFKIQEFWGLAALRVAQDLCFTYKGAVFKGR